MKDNISSGAFGSYSKPELQPKNITSDMWQPITTNNNFSAYVPSEKKKSPEARKPSQDKKPPQQKRTQPQKKTVSGRPTADKSKSGAKTQKPKAKAPEKKKKPSGVPTKKKTNAVNKPSPQKNGSVQKRSAPESKFRARLREREIDRRNLDFVRLVKKGKTPDEARVIATARRIRRKKIRTLGSVSLLTLFALSFIFIYTYFCGAVITDIIIEGDDVYHDSEILEAAGLSEGDNMLTVREKQLNDSVTGVLPFISEIALDYRLPDTIALNIISARERLILKCGSGYICVDKTGKVVSDKKKKLSEGQFLVQGLAEQEYTVGEAFVVSEENAERYNIACTIAETAEKAPCLNYGVLNLTDTDDIRFTYRSKIRLYLGDSDNLETKLNSAVEIYQSSDVGDKTGYINLKYDIGAYFMEGTME